MTRQCIRLALAVLAVIGTYAAVPAASAEKAAAADQHAVATKIAEFSDGSLVNGLSFSPNGDRIAVVGVSSVDVHVWSWKDKPHIVQTLQWPVGTPETSGGSLDTVSYSPDGKYLAFGHTSDASMAAEANADIPDDAVQSAYVAVRIFDANTGAIVHDISDEVVKDDTFSMAFSSDGKLFVRAVYRREGEGHAIEVYRTDDWSRINSFLGFPFTARVLALSPTQPMVAVGGEYWVPQHRTRLVLIDLSTNSILRTIDHLFPDPNQSLSLAWSADGKNLGAGTNIWRGIYPGPNAVVLLDVTTAEHQVNEAAEEADVTALCFSPDGRYLIEERLADKSKSGTHHIKRSSRRYPPRYLINQFVPFPKIRSFSLFLRSKKFQYGSLSRADSRPSIRDRTENRQPQRDHSRLAPVGSFTASAACLCPFYYVKLLPVQSRCGSGRNNFTPHIR